MSNSDRWFLEAMQNAVAAGHLTEDGADRVKTALFECCPTCDELVKKGDEHECPWTCDVCGQDCRDIWGSAAWACRRAYNAD